MRLAGKRIAITGANSGLGLGMARRFRDEGAQLAIFGRDRETLDKAVVELGAETVATQGDLRDLSTLDAFYETITDRFGHLDALVANAGAVDITPFQETTEEVFDFHTDILLKGTFFTVQGALPLLTPCSSVVMVGSIAATRGFPGMSAYGANKAAVRALARTLTAELVSTGIRFNVLTPGTFITPAFDRAGLPPDQLEAAKQGFEELIPMGRTGDIDELARVATMLVSDDSTFMSGAEVVVDGGAAHV